MPSTQPALRKSLRLKDYDYTQPGGYFITIVTHERLCLFGNISVDQIILNAAGLTIDRWWQEITHKFPNVRLDSYAIMPNHFHGLIMLGETIQTGAPGQSRRIAPTTSLPGIVQWFKTMTTNAYIRGVKESLWPPFHGNLWQRNYYEHVVHDDHDLNRLRL
jgi:putative transposase